MELFIIKFEFRQNNKICETKKELHFRFIISDAC